MKCPKCDQEMEKGNIAMPNGVTWYPGERKMGVVKDQEWLSGRWSFFGKQANAFICKSCKWISFGYPG